MTREQDIASYRALGSNINVQDMTPVPLTAANTTLNEGVGPWVRNPGKFGGIHIELSDTTTPTATVLVEYSNTQTTKGAAPADTVELTTAGQGEMVPTANGMAWVRIRVTAISGTSASVSATLSIEV